MIRVYAVYDTPIVLGRIGEHDMREVVFDIRDWLNDYDEGYAQLAVHRHGEENYYLVPLIREKGTVVWRVAAADVGVVGSGGECELSWLSNNGAFIKSTTWRTTVLDALNGGQVDVPDVSKAWLDAARELAGETQHAADEAIEAVGRAEEAADRAEDAADDATAAANTAQGYTNNPPKPVDGVWHLWDGEKYVEADEVLTDEDQVELLEALFAMVELASMGFTIVTADGYVVADVNGERISAKIGG